MGGALEEPSGVGKGYTVERIEVGSIMLKEALTKTHNQGTKVTVIPAASTTPTTPTTCAGPLVANLDLAARRGQSFMKVDSNSCFRKKDKVRIHAEGGPTIEEYFRIADVDSSGFIFLKCQGPSPCLNTGFARDHNVGTTVKVIMDHVKLEQPVTANIHDALEVSDVEDRFSIDEGDKVVIDEGGNEEYHWIAEIDRTRTSAPYHLIKLKRRVEFTHAASTSAAEVKITRVS